MEGEGRNEWKGKEERSGVGERKWVDRRKGVEGKGGRKERGNGLTGGKEWKGSGERGARARGTDWISQSDSPAGRWAKIQKFRWCRLNLATIIQPSIHYVYK